MVGVVIYERITKNTMVIKRNTPREISVAPEDLGTGLALFAESLFIVSEFAVFEFESFVEFIRGI